MGRLAVVSAFAALLAAAAVVVGCNPAITVQDLSVLPPGCRNPSACWSTSCACAHAKIGECLVCDPTKQTNQTCQCGNYDGGAPNSVCEDAVQVCVARAPVTCPGRGARCLHVDELTSMGCGAGGGVPPDVVGTTGLGDGGATLEQRCSFVDDVCCPGSDDGGAPFDAGTDQAVPDLATID